jgi:hypothetical protein
MSRVIVHIDKLVLRGVDRADAGALSADIGTQLQQSLAQGDVAGAVKSTGDRQRIKIHQSQPVSVRDGAAIGGAIARGITGGSSHDR